METFETMKNKKVMTIGIVSELTGLTVRKIRYYEQRGLLFPERTSTGNRKYSFTDVEVLLKIADQREEGVQTYEIKQQIKRTNRTEKQLKRNLIQGQINSHFGI